MEFCIRTSRNHDLDDLSTTEMFCKVSGNADKGHEVYVKILDKNLRLLEKGLESMYVIIDAQNYLHLCTYIELDRSGMVRREPAGLLANTLDLQSGRVNIVVLPQSNPRIQVVARPEHSALRQWIPDSESN